MKETKIQWNIIRTGSYREKKSQNFFLILHRLKMPFFLGQGKKFESDKVGYFENRL